MAIKKAEISSSEPHDHNNIGIDGIQQFCDDLGLNPTSMSVLLIAWNFRAATQCEFSKKEFIDGMTELGCDSIEKLKSRLPKIEQELSDHGKLKGFYQFTFDFANNPGQKGLGALPILIDDFVEFARPHIGSRGTALFKDY